MRKQSKAYLYTVIVLIFWSTVASAFKITLSFMDSISMLFYSSATSLCILTMLIAIQGKLNRFLNYSKSYLIQSFIFGFLNPFIYYLILFKAYSLLPAQEAQPLNQIWAIIIPFLSIIGLNQKINVKNIIGIVVSFIGVLIITTHGNIFALRFSNSLGVFLALGSAFIWALFWVYNVKDKRDDVEKLFLNFLFGFIFITITLIFVSRFSIPPFYGIIGAIYIGFFEMGITFIFWLKALQMSETTVKITNLIYLIPFISLFVINLTVGEKILWSTILGLIIIVGGIIIQENR